MSERWHSPASWRVIRYTAHILHATGDDDVRVAAADHLAGHDDGIADMTAILYGGSMNASNANELIACEDIDGGLIGGASLKAEDFLQICKVG